MRKVIYSLKNVSKIVDDGGVRRILDDINLDIYEGDFCGIVGESGAGKSTLLHILGGIDKASEGQIIFDREEVSLRNSKEMALFRRKIGFVFQSFQLINHFSVFDNVAAPLVITKTPKPEIEQKVISALQAVNFLIDPQEALEPTPRRRQKPGQKTRTSRHREQITPNNQTPQPGQLRESDLTGWLERRINQLPKTLSGGEKQRVAIARAIVTHPKIILADEPTGSLDSKNENIILDLLQEIHSKLGITVVLVSHSPTVVKRCSRLIRLADGKIIEDTLTTKQEPKPVERRGFRAKTVEEMIRIEPEPKPSQKTEERATTPQESQIPELESEPAKKADLKATTPQESQMPESQKEPIDIKNANVRTATPEDKMKSSRRRR